MPHNVPVVQLENIKTCKVRLVVTHVHMEHGVELDKAHALNVLLVLHIQILVLTVRKIAHNV